MLAQLFINAFPWLIANSTEPTTTAILKALGITSGKSKLAKNSFQNFILKD
jgi:hypothetical protein